MTYPVTLESSQTLSEVQMKMWEAGALMLALSTIVLFIIILGSIAWLCLKACTQTCELRFSMWSVSEREPQSSAHCGGSRSLTLARTGLSLRTRSKRDEKCPA
jgi:hypothetical protein